MARNSGNRSNSNGNSNSRGRSGSSNRQNESWYEGGVIDSARERPLKSAAVAAAAVGAGVFLWSRRNQISDQISQLSDQIGEWASNMNSGGGSDSDDTAGLTTSTSGTEPAAGRTSRSKGSRPTMTQGTSGGGNASLGASSGGSGTPTA